MILVGLLAMGAAQGMNSVIGSITNIVGFILVVGGIVEIFRKPKNQTPKA